MSATQATLVRPRNRLASVLLPMILTLTVAGGIALSVGLPGSGDTGATTTERPPHAPGQNGELRPT